MTLICLRKWSTVIYYMKNKKIDFSNFKIIVLILSLSLKLFIYYKIQNNDYIF
jgi:hypothetical protein